MKYAISAHKSARVAACTVAIAGLLSVGASLFGQARQSPADVQREAMHRLAFLVGHWSGPITVSMGPGEPLHLTQTEDVQMKLDGLVLLIEGKSTSADGKTMFNALATVSWDSENHSYAFRAYNQGRYLDTALTVTDSGFSWSYSAGPAHIANTMRLTAKDEWSETTDVTLGDQPAHRSVEMTLQRQP